ncbi:hypothetical protein GCM10010435_07260 [Winogradskya consettensis]|uniref:Uncharacterized protein n=2 Tax=Winogradskya consettensis TaxID=113560 RepID=A0A919SQN4_9ACTN|nr:hypothetical protein Aco04nite_46980 [Actinoplanes consettensis]
MLDLSPEATPWEQLTRSEGRRSGDTIVLFPEPVIEGDGVSSCSFFVHGIRHMMKVRPELESQLDGLTRGAGLALVDEPGNPANPKALLTTTADRRHPLGWVPDVLLDFVHAVRDSGSYELVVRQVNNSDVPIHQRLLVRLAGRTPAGFITFEGARWRPLARF